jgi:hypothetical protein
MTVSTLPDSSMQVKTKPLTRIDRERGIVRRSERMPLADAKLFCRRLANLQFVQRPVVTQLLHSKDGVTAIVQWEPAKDESKQALLMGFRIARIERAAAQLSQMSFYPIENRPGLFAAVNDDGHGQGSHVVDLVHEECDCTDYATRCRQLGEKCHHLHALDMHIEQATLPVSAPAPLAPAGETPAERHARCMANVNLDF